ncbi:MAG: PepSY domain-containing protein [Mariprofundaceae bacterium]|nr:PepSY domain-containing protein [Mariprofundaceae bacterium]
MQRIGRVLSQMSNGALLAIAIFSAPLTGMADEVDRVRELRDMGHILPLSQLLRKIELKYPGTLLDVDLEEEKGRVIYEIDLVGKDHVVHHIELDAHNGDIIAVDKDD